MKQEGDLLLKFIISFALFTALALLVSVSAFGQDLKSPAPGTRPELLIRHLERIQEDRVDLRGRFHQLREMALAGRTVESKGEFVFRQPDQLLLRYTQPEESEIVVNGHDVWIYAPARSEVQHFELDRRMNLSALLLGLGSRRFDVRSDFEVEPLQGAGAAKGSGIVLSPQPGSSLSGDVERVELLMDDDGLPRRVSVHGTSGDLLEFDLSGVEANTGVDPSSFEFVPPPGANVRDYTASR